MQSKLFSLLPKNLSFWYLCWRAGASSSYNFKNMSFHTQMFCNCFLLFKSPLQCVPATQELFTVLKNVVQWNATNCHSFKVFVLSIYLPLKNLVYTSAHPSVEFLIRNNLNFWIQSKHNMQSSREMQNSLEDPYIEKEAWRHWHVYLPWYCHVESIVRCRIEFCGTWLWDLLLYWTLMTVCKNAPKEVT